MNDPDRDFNKDLDLHDSEWTEAGKRQPIFGAGAGWFFKVTVPTIVCGALFAWFATWWVRLIDDMFGFPTSWFIAIPPLLIFAFFLVKPAFTLFFWLLDSFLRLLGRG